MPHGINCKSSISNGSKNSPRTQPRGRSSISGWTHSHTHKDTNMPRTSEMMESKYLKKEDFDEDGTICTIADFERVNVAKEDEKPEMKWMMTFKEFDKGMVLNSTNIQLAEGAMGSDNTDDWI